MTQPDPETFLLQFVSWEVATKENKWQGRNITRWTSKEADDAFKASQTELDPVKRAAHFITINDLACNDHAVIGVVYRPTVQALSSKLRGAAASGWDSNFWDLHNWYKEG
jgi:peptide/nickel transport system substrate-binding protein